MSDTKILPFLGRLSADPLLGPGICHIEHIPAQEVVFGTPSHPLARPVTDALSRKGIHLYSHQCEASDALLSGKNVVITTPTASGKSLAFSAPVFSILHGDPGATALFLYPAKALANDQLLALRAFEQETGIQASAAIYDGDTPAERRAGIRAGSRIILSNPHELHHVLAWHHQWSRFLSGLRVIVLDEAHRYRGVHGSHIALLIRRLRRICARYGSFPLFFLSTATLANPAPFAERLTGCPATAVTKDGAPRGERWFVLYDPSPGGGKTRAAPHGAAALFAAVIAADLQGLCFCGSRRTAELVTLMTRDRLIRGAGPEPSAVTAYRAGYLPHERRELETKLRQGALRGLVSTNALELGIDIGSLDAVIMAGYPGTMMAVRQQAGRAGRSGRESLAVLIARQDALDQFFLRNPAAFFAAPDEHAVINPGNPSVLAGHLLCAASELPLDPERDRAFFGDGVEDFIGACCESGLLSRTRRGAVYTGTRRAADLVSINGCGGAGFRVMCRGKVLETLDRFQAYREAHEGAILLHQGERYLVTAMDHGTGTIRAEPTDLPYHTRPLADTMVRVIQTVDSREHGDFLLSYGDVEVTERISGFRMLRYDTVIGYEPLELPPLIFPTKALWVTVPERVSEACADAGRDLPGSLHGAEHVLIAAMPLHLLCDRRDLGGVSTPCGNEGLPAIYLYDGYEGGAGLAEGGYRCFAGIAKTAAGIAGNCTCQDGCPACVLSPKCGNDNEPMDRDGAALLLRMMAAGPPGGPHIAPRGAGQIQAGTDPAV